MHRHICICTHRCLPSPRPPQHVAIVGELSRLLDTHDLLALSEAEQELACQSNHSEVVHKVRELLVNPKIRPKDRVRLVMLYALRYETTSSNHLSEFIDTLSQQDVDESLRFLIASLRAYAGLDRPGRSSDLFGVKGATGFLKQIRGLKGVENIYTQHVPLLFQTLDALAKVSLPRRARTAVRDGLVAVGGARRVA